MTTAPDPAQRSLGAPPTDAATYEQLLELTRHRRSVRAIDSKREVSDETIDKTLEVARWAPSAGNAQPWELLVVRDAETRGRIADLNARQMADKREMQEAVWGHRTTSATPASGTRRSSCWYSATLG